MSTRVGLAIPWLAAVAVVHAVSSEPVQLLQTIPLPGVEGRIDHIAMDLAGQRLFVAALGNGSVEIVDLRAGRRIRAIGEPREPQGIAYSPGTGRLFVACGGDGSLRVYDGKSFQLLQTIDLKEDADNVRYDAATERLYVGYGSGGIAIVDARSGERVGDLPLPGHAESFELEQQGRRVFVNVPTTRQVVVLDREKHTAIATWPLKEAAGNFPMALDEADHRLFVGCRGPPRLAILDTQSGNTVVSVPIHGDPDDVAFDAKRKLIYVSCGAGWLDVVQQSDADRYSSQSAIETTPGARTSLFVPELKRLFLAVPHRGKQPAEVWVYSTEP